MPKSAPVAAVKMSDEHSCLIFLPPNLHQTLKSFAKARKIRLSHLVEHILSVVTASGQLETLCLDIVPLPSEQSLSVESLATGLTQRKDKPVPRRATAVRRRLDGEVSNLSDVVITPDRHSEFEKLKSLYEYPGTHLDKECVAASKEFLNYWDCFSDTEQRELLAAQSRRADIYEQWKRYHSEITACIVEAEKRLQRKTGRAHRIVNAELRKLRAARTDFEKTVRWNLRKFS